MKIVLADKQAIFRAGIAKVLGVEDEMRIVAQVQASDQIAPALEKFRPQILIFASSLSPDVRELAQIAARFKTRLVVVAENGEPAAAIIGAGAHGVVYRNVGSQALMDCIRKITQGETWVQDTVVPTEVSENDMVGARVRDRLTPKELRIRM